MIFDKVQSMQFYGFHQLQANSSRQPIINQIRRVLKFYISAFLQYQMQIEKPAVQRIICLKVLDRKSLFKQALGDLYSDRYFLQQQKHFDEIIFKFQVSTTVRVSYLLKQSGQMQTFFADEKIKSKISKNTLQLIQKMKQEQLQKQGQIFQQALAEVCTVDPSCLSLNFFEQNKSSYHCFMMRKLSGGRYKQSMCCKMGAIFKGWKERKVNIYSKGVGYYNENNQLREFLSYSQGFHFQFGKPQTGIQFGIILFANHRKLSLQAKNIRDFVYFLFVLRRSCEQSCYMSLNRFNSFAPIRVGNSVKFLVDGQEYFEAVYHSIQKAKHNILITGWFLSPQFLLVRGDKGQKQKSTLQSLLIEAAKRGVRISIIVYHQSCFLPNDSLYFKEKLQGKSSNIVILRHPCDKIPILWSHHGKTVIVDESEAFLGGFDLCYGRYDDQKHQLFGGEVKYPGIEYNNTRTNDQLNVRNPTIPHIMRNQPRLPWHDVGLCVRGKVTSDLVHHFYQLWHFVRYENKIQQEQNQNGYSPSLFQVDVKSVFSTKVIPEQQPKTLFKSIENKISKLKKTVSKKGREMIKKVRKSINQIGNEQKQPSQIKIRLSANEDYFEKYFKEVNQQVAKIQSNQQKIMKKKIGGAKRRGSGISKRFSVQAVKQVKNSLQVDQVIQKGPKKTNSFLLSGDKIGDFMSLYIDKDYINCLEKVNQKRQKNGSTLTKQDKQIQSDQEQEEMNSQLCHSNYHGEQPFLQGNDQCQLVRSVGTWSIGCHPSNNQFSIQISYLQLISQAKSYIYIQNQFFISSTADPSTVKNQVAYALYLRIVKAIQHNQEFRVYIVLPLIPGFSGDLENDQCLLLRKVMQWQYDTICRGQSSLWQRLLNHTNDPSRYIQFFGLRNHGRFDQMSQPVTQIVYLHSKIMIIDDQIVLCGSANINDRSMVGNRDSQIAMITRSQDFVQGVINGQSVLVSQLAHQLRIKLWKQHFGFAEEQILDPVCSETWEKITNRVEANTDLYRRIFGCYPDNLMTTRKKITDVRLQSDIELYRQLKDKIMGHAVEFPLDFLREETLSCFITQKQFYVPNECLT